MCGIAGVIHRDPHQPVSLELVRALCAALEHRGPDDEGLYVRGPVGLGMRRLSIIDVSGSQQPIFNEDGSKVIVFNGEIYNYRELRRGLIARGHVLRTQGDTETVLHLYEELGPACVEQLRGMFAFAIWDATQRTLLLGRDRFGIKPLYVLTAPWGIAFASELKALHAAGLTSRALDWEALDAFLHVGYIPAPATPFQDVRKLEPGHTLVWKSNGGDSIVRRYWHLPPDGVGRPPTVEARIRDWVDESVAAHLVSDVPVAAFLSGGLDSSTVVASMALVGEPPHAFTARYFGSGQETVDETGLARELARRYGVNLTVVDIHPNIREIFEPIVWALDEPHADDSAIPTWLLSQAVGRDYKVALTGIGGDELFGGYPRHIGLPLAEIYGKLPAGVRRLASAAAQLLPEPRTGTLGVDRIKRFLRSGDGDLPERYLSFMSRLANGERSNLYAPALRASITGDAARARLRSLYHDEACPSGPTAALYLDYTAYLPDDLLALSDRLAMAHGLEIRVPFVDHELATRVFPLPYRLKIGWWRNKRLLKRAMHARLPEAHSRAPKRGFVGPTAAWLRNELRGMLEDELSPDRQRRLGYFHPPTVDRLLREHATGRHNRERILWALLSFSTWHRIFVESSARGSAAGNSNGRITSQAAGDNGTVASQSTWAG
ncbi:MAG: asparagine synthase (glutamine-hydrolyzing) [Gemmatimonadetes bacterium]|nr:MAG: asparagine synthase (glutamine-hydrolyzing) [Gemmatimonadota bacterium]